MSLGIWDRVVPTTIVPGNLALIGFKFFDIFNLIGSPKGKREKINRNNIRSVTCCFIWAEFTCLTYGSETDMHGPNGQNVTIWRATRLVLPKFAQKRQKCQLNSQDLVIFVKSHIW